MGRPPGRGRQRWSLGCYGVRAFHMNRTLPPAARYRHVVFPEPRPWPAGFAVRGAIATSRPAGGDATGVELPMNREEQAFVAWLFASAGLDASRYKPETLQRRLPACLRSVRAT